ncbi:DUF397 domain-containing protein [Actinomadura gamaensis]|uniref:DUF397 domain-containing protein n=1 Tax=Actinomadura gamaensis TaxID=1763541 RepID=A0ABV9U720_9ACTN
MDVTTLQWRKSSRSHDDGDHCVELADASTGVAIRDSKNPDGGHVTVERAAFCVVLEQIKSLKRQ